MKPKNENSGTDRRCVRVNLSLPFVLREASTQVIERKGFVGLSDYVQACLRRDAASIGLNQFSLAAAE